MKKVLILTEAGDKIGFGHYTRCSAIQNYLLSIGHDCEMVLNLVGDFDLRLSKGQVADWANEPKIIQEYSQKFEVVLIDSYLASSDFYTFLKKNFQKTVAIDDYNRITYEADMLINPNVVASEIDYSNQIATIIGGSDYVILRSVFRNPNNKNPVREQAKKVVITVGGTDYRNILPTIINGLEPFDYERIVITGNVQLQAILQEQYPTTTILGLLTAEEMYEQFHQGDFVIAACGQTLHELASMGQPTIGICLDIDQIPNQDFYHKKGFLTTKWQWNEMENFEKDVMKMSSFDYRKTLSDIGKSIIKINGVENIASVLIK